MKAKRSFLNWRFVMGIILLTLSAVLYYVHFLIFRNARHIFIYLFGDIAFVPIEVLIVTLIIHQLLERRERRSLLNKMNMLIGAFYSEVGAGLLRSFTGFDKDVDKFREKFIVEKDWSEEHFGTMSGFLEHYHYDVDSRRGDLKGLKAFLSQKKKFLLDLLANPNLLEHESFTELLWAVFHLSEELDNRRDLTGLPDTDLDHISGDIKRAYTIVAKEWLVYLRHLKKDYPYLFSLALRTNPFDIGSSAEVV